MSDPVLGFPCRGIGRKIIVVNDGGQGSSGDGAGGGYLARFMRWLNAVSVSIAASLIVSGFASLNGYFQHLPSWMYVGNAIALIVIVVGGSNVVYFNLYKPLSKEKEKKKLATRIFVAFFILLALIGALVTHELALYNQLRITTAKGRIRHPAATGLSPEFREICRIYERCREDYSCRDLEIYDMEVAFHLVDDVGAVEHRLRGRSKTISPTKTLVLPFFHGSDSRSMEDPTDFFAVDVLNYPGPGDTARCETWHETVIVDGMRCFIFHPSIPLHENGEFEIVKSFCAPGAVPGADDAFFADLSAFPVPTGLTVVKLYSDQPLIPFFLVVRREGAELVSTTIAVNRVEPIGNIPESKKRRKIKYGYKVVLEGKECESVILVEFHRPVRDDAPE